MTANLILHNYPESPYAEKVRAMLGYTGLGWQSVAVDPQPPRPSLDPVLGGYRRIPVAQDGADYYCDSATIAHEIAHLSNKPELAPENVPADLAAFMDHAESDVFAAAIFAAPKGKMLFTMLLKSPIGLYKFMKDRVGAAKDGNLGNVTPATAKDVWEKHLEDLSARLTQDFLGGATPNIADFAAYHTVWIFAEQSGGKIAQEKVRAWQARIAAFGHGSPTQLSTEASLDAARDATPKPITEGAVAGGTKISIAPADYMRNATEGTLVGETDLKWIIARDTKRAGTVHVHFPKAGYEISR